MIFVPFGHSEFKVALPSIHWQERDTGPGRLRETISPIGTGPARGTKDFITSKPLPGKRLQPSPNKRAAVTPRWIKAKLGPISYVKTESIDSFTVKYQMG
jgi:hypothetical protein